MKLTLLSMKKSKGDKMSKYKMDKDKLEIEGLQLNKIRMIKLTKDSGLKTFLFEKVMVKEGNLSKIEIKLTEIPLN